MLAVAVKLVVVGVVFVVVMVDVCNSSWLIVCCSVGCLLVDRLE